MKNERKGVAAVEFAIVLPLLLTLLLGIWEIGRVVNTHHTLMAGVRDAGRQAAAGMPVEELPDVVLDSLANSGLQTTNVKVNVDTAWSLESGEDACRVTVSIPIQDVQWGILHRFTSAADRISVETVWPRD